MIKYYIHEKMIMDTAKAYQIIFDTINKAEGDLKKELDTDGKLLCSSFQNFVIYLLISPYENEKVDMMHIIERDYARQLEENDLLSRFVHKLLTYELMPLKESEIEEQMKKYDPFLDSTENNKSHMREFIR